MKDIHRKERQIYEDSKQRQKERKRHKKERQTFEDGRDGHIKI